MRMNKKTLDRIDTALDTSLIAVGRQIADIQVRVIQETVYDYYEKLRAGHITQDSILYHRTDKLKDRAGISVYHGRKGQVVIRNDNYSTQLINWIRFGSNSWKNSYLYNQHWDARKRDFVAVTMKKLEKVDLKNKIKLELYKNGIRVNRG